MNFRLVSIAWMPMSSDLSSARVQIDSHRIATIWLDAPGKRVNTLSRQMWGDLGDALDQVKKDGARGMIVTSAKPDSFVVGADLTEIRDMNDEQFDDYIQIGQDLLK